MLLTEALGSDLLVHMSLDTPGGRSNLTARLTPAAHVRAGERVRLLIDPSRMHFFDPESELAIR